MRRKREKTSADLVAVEQSLRVLGKRITMQEASALYEALGRHLKPHSPLTRKRRRKPRARKTV